MESFPDFDMNMNMQGQFTTAGNMPVQFTTANNMPGQFVSASNMQGQFTTASNMQMPFAPAVQSPSYSQSIYGSPYVAYQQYHPSPPIHYVQAVHAPIFPLNQAPQSTNPNSPSTEAMTRSRSNSTASNTSRGSGRSARARKAERCDICGKSFKDIKAHKMTHQDIRENQCSVKGCKYYLTGFARSYDRKRHGLAHWKAELRCPFCIEGHDKADLFKKHLQSAHSCKTRNNLKRKNSLQGNATDPRIMGNYTGQPVPCPVCNTSVVSPQALHDHIEDCIIEYIKKTQPSEEINERNLSTVLDDPAVLETLLRNNLLDDLNPSSPHEYNEEKPEGSAISRSGRGAISGKASVINATVKSSSPHSPSRITKKSQTGMTRSKTGGSLNRSKASKNGRQKGGLPVDWNRASETMTVIHRTATVFDGPVRLNKDELAVDRAYEVPITYGNAGTNNEAYVTDLDVHTLRRADAFFPSTLEDFPAVSGDRSIDLNTSHYSLPVLDVDVSDVPIVGLLEPWRSQMSGPELQFSMFPTDADFLQGLPEHGNSEL